MGDRYFDCHEHSTGSKPPGNFCVYLLENHLKNVIKVKKKKNQRKQKQKQNKPVKTKQDPILRERSYSTLVHVLGMIMGNLVHKAWCETFLQAHK